MALFGRDSLLAVLYSVIGCERRRERVIGCERRREREERERERG